MFLFLILKMITQILLIPGFTGPPVVTLFFLVPWMSDNRAFKEFLNFLEYNLRLVNYICVVYLAFFPAANIYPGISSFLRTLPCSQRLMNGIHHVFIKLQRCLLLESEPLTNPSTRIRRRVFIICNWVQFTLSAPTFNLAWESTDNQVHHCLKIMIQHAHESDLKQYLACIVRAPLMNLFFSTIVLCIYLIVLLALKFLLHVVIAISM